MKLAYLTLAALLLSGCMEPQPAQKMSTQPAPQAQPAAAPASPAPAPVAAAAKAPTGAATSWDAFINDRQRAGRIENPTPLSLSQMEGICRTALNSGMSMKTIVETYGFAHGWNHNGGKIEAASYKIAPNPERIIRMSIFYTRAGKIRNIAYHNDSNKHRGGISDWMSADQKCTLGLVHPRLR